MGRGLKHKVKYTLRRTIGFAVVFMGAYCLVVLAGFDFIVKRVESGDSLAKTLLIVFLLQAVIVAIVFGIFWGIRLLLR